MKFTLLLGNIASQFLIRHIQKAKFNPSEFCKNILILARVLFLIGKYPSYGGTETITTLLANEFVSRNHKVGIVSFEQPVPELSQQLCSTVKLFELSFPAYSRNNISTLRNIVISEKFNVVINQWCLPFYTNKLIKRATKGQDIKVISVLHGMPHKNKRVLDLELKIKASPRGIGSYLNPFILKLLLKVTGYNLNYVYNRSDRYVLLSESFKHVFISLSSIKETSKLKVINNPLTIDNTSFHYEPMHKEKKLLYVGRMDHTNKRVHRIIEAWECVCQDFPDWKLELVGDGPDKENLLKYVRNNEIPNVSFIEFQKDPPIENYESASIILLTSELEGFGLVILEGMSFGVVPVVYASYSAIYDIVEDDFSGMLIEPPYSKAKMISKLTTLMGKPESLQCMAKRSIRKACSFKVSEVVNEWEALFTEIGINQYNESTI